jgi:S1-C subfamily serine protease
MPVFAAQQPKSTADIAETISRATVVVAAALDDGGVSTGSGVIVESSGTTITNFHVIQGAIRIEVALANGDRYTVSGLRAVDQHRDLAILQIPAFDLTVAPLGNSNSVRLGDSVLAMGTPLGLLQNTVTKGIISAIRQADGSQLFQMDAAISKGNSGGPVVDESGSVIGISVAKFKEGESLNFAVPINYARGLVASPVAPGLALLPAPSQPAASQVAPASAAQKMTSRWFSGKVNALRLVEQSRDSLLVELPVSGDVRTLGGYIRDWRREGDSVKPLAADSSRRPHLRSTSSTSLLVPWRWRWDATSHQVLARVAVLRVIAASYVPARPADAHTRCVALEVPCGAWPRHSPK